MTQFEILLSALLEHRVSFIIIGGIAATLHGSARLTNDLDIAYERSDANIEHLAEALAPFKPYLRGAPEGLPFRFDAPTIRRGLNFTLRTSAGDIDVLGEVTGVGNFQAIEHSSRGARPPNGVAALCLCSESAAQLRASRSWAARRLQKQPGKIIGSVQAAAHIAPALRQRECVSVIALIYDLAMFAVV